MITKLLSLAKQYALPLFVVYALAIAVLSLISIGKLPETAPEFSDKIVHCLAYALFAALFYNYLEEVITKPAILVVVLSMLYGTIIEVLQYTLNPDRTFDLWDIVANGVGIVIAIIIIRVKKT
ncbi:VanZ family protein [Winogradskyella sp. 3972H.M.0a.05]|uniref:VanZ family protein n=1 Tax=Winogradskyella sp. 3972H.M.0a.05 TaxID=2950277 RepID=UPI003392D894